MADALANSYRVDVAGRSTRSSLATVPTGSDALVNQQRQSQFA
jgi:hypothetical protein